MLTCERIAISTIEASDQRIMTAVVFRAQHRYEKRQKLYFTQNEITNNNNNNNESSDIVFFTSKLKVTALVVLLSCVRNVSA